MLKKPTNILFFICVFVFMNIVAPLIILQLTKLISLTHIQLRLTAIISVPIIYVLAVLITIKWFNINLDFTWAKTHPIIIGYILFLGLLLYIFQVTLDKLFISELINGNLRFLNIKTQFETGVFEVTSLIVTILLGPILEELFFRRLMFKKLMEQYSVLISMVITSLLFAIGHQRVEWIFAYFCIGFAYNYLYHLTKSLWLNIIIHVFYNFLASVTIIKTYSSGDSFYLLGIIIYIICIYGVFITFKKIKSYYILNLK